MQATMNQHASASFSFVPFTFDLALELPFSWVSDSLFYIWIVFLEDWRGLGDRMTHPHCLLSSTKNERLIILTYSTANSKHQELCDFSGSLSLILSIMKVPSVCQRSTSHWTDKSNLIYWYTSMLACGGQVGYEKTKKKTDDWKDFWSSVALVNSQEMPPLKKSGSGILQQDLHWVMVANIKCLNRKREKRNSWTSGHFYLPYCWSQIWNICPHICTISEFRFSGNSGSWCSCL